MTIDDPEIAVRAEGDLYARTVAERARLTDLLSDLPAQAWGTASLCAGWNIRHVVAHINMSDTRTMAEFQDAVAAAGGDINLACDRMARADVARSSDTELLAIQRARIASHWTPGPGNQQGALAHEAIHGLDITVPLGLPAAAPDVLAAALGDADPASLAFFGVDLTGVRLVATDGPLRIGPGPRHVEVTSAELVLIVTGRHRLPALPAATPADGGVMMGS
ncbi:maleylpyruvate isomerase family mycothiol-dependent enzyme [Granulicoccus phenolivorans]|uniref:maleylpyruvate isomerase family mycothiol-dependent enzyme n=1 Tax=Granulicoccus phenolivorans TaxID=266854 RepID=UPI000402114B|nr:maleylpyruvate isomerase family mycothiol-dependent enzyme [Granulicoccus phenolivorans]